jgi:hypothetical protein
MYAFGWRFWVLPSVPKFAIGVSQTLRSTHLFGFTSYNSPQLVEARNHVIDKTSGADWTETRRLDKTDTLEQTSPRMSQDCVTCPEPAENGNGDIEDIAGTNRLNAEAAAAAHARVSGGTGDGANLRSRRWFNDPHDIGMTSLYLERFVWLVWIILIVSERVCTS